VLDGNQSLYGAVPSCACSSAHVGPMLRELKDSVRTPDSRPPTCRHLHFRHIRYSLRLLASVFLGGDGGGGREGEKECRKHCQTTHTHARPHAHACTHPTPYAPPTPLTRVTADATPPHRSMWDMDSSFSTILSMLMK
jgi:hypothetical protein